MMSDNDESTNELEDLKKGVFKFLDIYRRHGEASASAASAQHFMNFVDKSAEKADSIPKMQSRRKVVSGLDNIDVRKVKCTGSFKTCVSRQITDDDVKALFSKKNENPFNQGNSSTVDDWINSFTVNREKSPPRKIQNKTSSEEKSALIGKINNSFSSSTNKTAQNQGSSDKIDKDQEYSSTIKNKGFPNISAKANDFLMPKFPVNRDNSPPRKIQAKMSSEEKSAFIEKANRSFSRSSNQTTSDQIRNVSSSHNFSTHYSGVPNVQREKVSQPQQPGSVTISNDSNRAFTSALEFHNQNLKAQDAPQRRKTLGMTGYRSKIPFKPPLLENSEKNHAATGFIPVKSLPLDNSEKIPSATGLRPFKSPVLENSENNPAVAENPDPNANDLLKSISPEILEIIKGEVVDNTQGVSWDDIAGLKEAKRKIQEVVMLPLIRSDLFIGLRSVPKGILLFGPPGTGKTLIGRCIASQAKATFFSISSSSLTSKWIGEGEKLVRAMFLYARHVQPSVIFIDEIDSILQKRNSNEHESSRRLKTEFLLQLDGAFKTADTDRILIVGATNRPDEIDDAAKRRFSKRLYIPLPDAQARKELVMNLLKREKNNLSERELGALAASTEGYSGDDIKNLCQDAAMQPIRDHTFSQLENLPNSQIRLLSIQDFVKSLSNVKASNAIEDIKYFEDWNLKFGS